MEYKRLVLLCGHYGSGKTNVAVNMAKDMASRYPSVGLADLDIVNPYFRSVDSADELRDLGVRVICSAFANSNLDVPALPQDIYTVTDDRHTRFVIDVGGDERGALALGRISDAIREENDYDMFLVVNRFRPLTPDALSVLEVMNEISGACKLPFTGIINNSNLGAETDPDTVLGSVGYGREVSRVTGLPLVATSVAENLYPSLMNSIPDLFPLRLQRRPVDA